MSAKSILGIPRSAWTDEDWEDLYFALEDVKRRILRRHRRAKQSAKTAPVPPEHNCKPLTAERASGNLPT